MNLDSLLKDFLTRLNDAVERKVTVIIIGGNALFLLGIKKMTKDIDIVYRSSQPEVGSFCREYFNKYRIKAHVFVDGLFKTIRIKDYLKRAIPLDLPDFPNLEIKMLNIYDIILTKISRWLKRDQEDIGNVLTKIKINKSELDKRFKYLLKFCMGPKQDFIKHYEEFKDVFSDRLF